MRKLRNLSAVAALAALTCTACADLPSDGEGDGTEPTDAAQDGANPLESGALFVAIPRTVEPAELATRTRKLAQLGVQRQALAKGPSDFYLAIRKSALDKKWFMSGFLKTVTDAQGLTSAGAYNQGSDVVGFRVQNEKLYVYRADEGHKWSDAFDPSIIIDAYPIVTGLSAFDRLGGAGDYVLVNPGAGLNNIVLTGAFSTSTTEPTAGSRLDVDVAYLENFTRLDDGVAFDVVVGGTVDTIDPNTLGIRTPTLAMTTTLSLRAYGEGAGYTPTLPPPVEHYFLAPRHVLKDQGTVASTAAIKWNVHPGMKPIEWVITQSAVALGAQYGVPLVDIITRGIESWNGVFGFPVVKARLANENEKVGRDDRNFFIVDSNLAGGGAYAQPRTNPNTGEIRGASVYMPAGFFAQNPFTDDAVAADEGSAEAMPLVRWNGLSATEPTCGLPVMRTPELAREGQDDTALTAGEKLANYLQQVVTHEIGHTFGLRHNFKGSLVPPSSSVMDYLSADDTIATPTPQAYDVDAIHYLYGLADELPAQPFCNDSGVATDPDCARFDSQAEPVSQYWGPTYAYLNTLATSLGGMGAYKAYFDYYGTPLFTYVRAGSANQAPLALAYLTYGVAAPIAAEHQGDAAYGAAADELMAYVLTRLYSDSLDVRRGPGGQGPSGDPTDAGVVATLTAQLAALVTNVDGVRSFENRRLAVDYLRHLQSTAAYEALLGARAQLGAALEDGSLTGEQALLTRDLLARIDAATSPYFE